MEKLPDGSVNVVIGRMGQNAQPYLILPKHLGIKVSQEYNLRKAKGFKKVFILSPLPPR